MLSIICEIAELLKRKCSFYQLKCKNKCSLPHNIQPFTVLTPFVGGQQVVDPLTYYVTGYNLSLLYYLIL